MYSLPTKSKVYSFLAVLEIKIQKHLGYKNVGPKMLIFCLPMSHAILEILGLNRKDNFPANIIA